MKTEVYNQLAFYISIVAAVISLFAILISVILKIKSDAIAIEANKTANKALEIATFGYKKDILPELKARFLPVVNDFCFFIIANVSHGKAIISNIQTAGVILNEIENNIPVPIKYPITLLYNNDIFLKAVAEIKVGHEDLTHTFIIRDCLKIWQ